MLDEFESQNEEELRRSIRAEIAQRDQELARRTQEQAKARNAGVSAERRRQIYQEELRRYYAQKPGYREVRREDGESDWVPESEILRSEELFDEALADPLDVRKRLKWSLAAGGAAVAILAAILFFVLAAKTGSISVSANVPDAQIILDTDTLQHFTNTIIEEVPEGDHVVTLWKEGYIISGEAVQSITVRGGKTNSLSFMLLPVSVAEQKGNQPYIEVEPMGP